jgi:regulatory protein
MHITKIEAQKKNPARKNLFIDGEFAVGVSAETLVRFGLRTGDEIGPDKITALQQTEELLSAKRVALRYLATRPRTEREVRDKLRDKEFGDEEIAKAIDDLKQAGLINDAAFAGMFIRDALGRRPVGKILLKQKMVLLGLGRQTIEEALQKEFESGNQEGAALEAAKKFMKKSKAGSGKLDEIKLKNRVAAFLGRRGFTWDIIQPTLKELFAKEHREENVE